MSCNCSCKVCPTDYAMWVPRIGFGVALAGFGLNHYRFIGDFTGMAASVYPSVPILGTLAGLLAYIVPALMIVGGILFAIDQQRCISKSCILAALGGIIGWAGLGVLVGDGSAGPTLMPMIQGAILWLVGYYIIKKMCCCCGGSCKPNGMSK